MSSIQIVKDELKQMIKLIQKLDSFTNINYDNLFVSLEKLFLENKFLQ